MAVNKKKIKWILAFVVVIVLVMLAEYLSTHHYK